MSNGKFSQPRPNRDEEREIEQAFRQLTGQAPIPESPPQETIRLDTDDFDLNLDLDLSEEPLPPVVPIPPVTQVTDPFPDDFSFADPIPADPVPADPVPAEKPADFGTKAMLLLEQAVRFCEQNRKVVLVSLCGLALVLILMFMGIFLAGTSDPYDKTILTNVIIADVNVGGMTREEAVSAVKQATSHTYPVLDMVVDLSGKELRLSPADTGVALDVQSAVDAAYDYGRTGTKAEKEQAYLNSLTGNHIIGLLPYLELDGKYIMGVLENYAMNSGSTLTQPSYGLDGRIPDLDAPNFDPTKSQAPTLVIRLGTPGIGFNAEAVYNQIMDAYSLHDFQVTVRNVDTVTEPNPVDLEAIYKEFCIEPVNATVNHQNFEVTPGIYGCGFDMALAKQSIDAAAYGAEIRIPMNYIAPTVMNSDMFFQDVLAEYETTYKDRGNLQTNLKLACEAINGTVVNPGESFSFNDTVGQPTAAKGYKHADDHIGQYKNRILGGGISQVSSALYYCTLVADLSVTNRVSHTVIPGYTDYGLDAAVGWNSPDFKFTNSLGLPIKIQASAENGVVSVSILGTDEWDYYVAMDYEISGTKAFKTEYRDYKANNEEGYEDGDVVQEGVMGYIIKTYRMKYDDHTRELISRDYVTTTQYSSVTKIIARVAEKETTEATEETKETTEATEAPATATTEPTAESTTPSTTETPVATTEAPTVPETTQAAPAETKASEAADEASDESEESEDTE